MAAVVAVTLCAQIAEGYAWYAFGNYNMATTQLRVTNMASSLAVISSVMLVSSRLRSAAQRLKPLVRLGDLSFGVYLCHMALGTVEAKLLSTVGVSGIAPSLAMWAAVVVLSSAAVALCRRVLPKRLQRLIGFA